MQKWYQINSNKYRECKTHDTYALMLKSENLKTFYSERMYSLIKNTSFNL